MNAKVSYAKQRANVSLVQEIDQQPLLPKEKGKEITEEDRQKKKTTAE